MATGACDFCGCALGECECDERHPRRVITRPDGIFLVENYAGFDACEFFRQLADMKAKSRLATFGLVTRVFRKYPAWTVSSVMDGRYMFDPRGVIVFKDP